jgi:hypothetical protein
MEQNEAGRDAIEQDGAEQNIAGQDIAGQNDAIVQDDVEQDEAEQDDAEQDHAEQEDADAEQDDAQQADAVVQVQRDDATVRDDEQDAAEAEMPANTRIVNDAREWRQEGGLCCWYHVEVTFTNAENKTERTDAKEWRQSTIRHEGRVKPCMVVTRGGINYATFKKFKFK